MGKRDMEESNKNIIHIIDNIKSIYPNNYMVNLCGVYYSAGSLDWVSYKRVIKEFNCDMSAAFNMLSDTKRKELLMDTILREMCKDEKMQTEMFCMFATMFLREVISLEAFGAYIFCIGIDLTDEFYSASDEAQRVEIYEALLKALKTLKDKDAVFEEENE